MATQVAKADTQRVHDLWQEKLAADSWNGWRALLNGWEIEGTKVPVDGNTPFQGFYRTKRKDKTFGAVAFWHEDGHWKCLIDGQLIDEEKAIEQWPWISRYPISRAWYVAVAEEGKPWPDADERVTSQALSVAGEREAPAPIGHNAAPEETEIETIRNKIENAKGGLSDYAVIKDDETLAKAKSLKNRLTELAGEADKRRDELKRPHLEAGRKVDEDWQPIIKDAKAAAKQINEAMDAWETEKLRARRKAEAEAAAAAAEAERIQRENAEKLRVAEKTGIKVELAPVPEVKAPQVAVENTIVRPGYGKAGRVKTEWVVTEITDIDALFGLLKTHPELKTLMLQLAQRAKNAGIDPPGVKCEERAKVR